MIHPIYALSRLATFPLMYACLGSLLFATAMHISPQNPEDARPLTSESPIEREMSGGQKHLYQFTMKANQYMKIVANQRGVDVTLSLIDQNGKTLAGAENNRGDKGVELFLWQAQTEGRYRIEIAAKEKNADRGLYELRLEIIDSNEDALATFQKHIEARQLLSQRTRENAEQARKLLEESLPVWRKLNDHQMEALTLLQLASISAAEKSLDYYQKSLPIFRSLEMKAEEARVLNVIGSTYKFSGNNTDAIRYLEQGLLLYDYLSPSSGLHLLISLGDSYWRMGEMQKGLAYLERALSTSRATGNEMMELSCLVKIGEQYLATDNTAVSAEYVNTALSLARKLKAANYEGILLCFQGQIHLLAGDDQKALELFQQSLDLHQNQKSGHRINAAERRMDIGRVYSYRADLQSALEHYQQALAIFRSSSSIEGEALALSEIGLVLSKQGEYQKALDFLNRALAITREIGNRSTEVSTLINMTDTLERMGDREGVLRLLDETLMLCRKLEHYQGESMVLIRKARLARKMGDLNQARQLFETTLRASEARRLRFGLQGMKESFGAGQQSYYEEYTELLMQLHEQNPRAGEDRNALQISERARARGLLELLAESRADIRRGADPALLEKERALQQRLNAKDIARRQALNSKNTADQAASLAKEIDSLTAEMQLVESQIRASSPHYAALIQPQPLSATEIQQQLLDENSVLLEFALGEKQSWLWAVTRDALSSFKLPSHMEIETASRKVYELLTVRQAKNDPTQSQYQTVVAEADAKFRTEAALLSRMLLGQIAAKLQQEWKGKRLMIVATGALEYLPFAALPIPATDSKSADGYQPLIAEHEIVNLPSASVLAVIRREIAGRQAAVKTVAVLADPVFESGDPRVQGVVKKKSELNDLSVKTRTVDQSPPTSALETNLQRSLRSFNRTRGALSRLPFSREEAEAIALLAPKGGVMKATDFRADRILATGGDLGRYRIIHFATHGLLNSEHPGLSGLVLSLVNENGRAQDGFLRMHEIYNLQLSADVVVLSACQTALGQEIKGEGLIGMTRGFMYAGAQRVVASLWQVDDLATRELMERFYRGMLKNGLRPAAALRAAQLDMLKEKRWAAPFFWSAFVIQGEWK